MIRPETQIMDVIAHTLDRCLEAAGMDAVDALRSFFVLAAATVRPSLDRDHRHQATSLTIA